MPVQVSSGSGDYPQQYYFHRPKLMPLEKKDFFDFFSQKVFFTVTHLSKIISPD